jgi:hypothetical protein
MRIAINSIKRVAVARRGSVDGSRQTRQTLPAREDHRRLPSPRHRNSLGKGCAVAALGADLPRQPKKVLAGFTERLEEGLAVLAALVPAKAASRRRDVLGNGRRPDSRARGRRRLALTPDSRDGSESAEEQRRGLGIREGFDPEIPRSHGGRNDHSVAVALDRGALGSYHRPGSTGFGI